MQSELGPGLRHGFDEADTETVEAQRRRQSWKAETAVHAGPVADIGMSNERDSGRASASGERAFGDLASGTPGGAGTGADLAHDFSNLAMSVVSAANLLQRCGDDPVRVAQIARLLRETGERAVAISRSLRPRPPQQSTRRVLLVEEDPPRAPSSAGRWRRSGSRRCRRPTSRRPSAAAPPASVSIS